MTKTFLKAKHWQLFILAYGAIIIFYLFYIDPIIPKTTFGESQDPELVLESFESMLNQFKYIPFIMMSYVLIYFGWLWSVAIGLGHKIPENLKLKTGRFKLFFIVPILYIPIVMGFAVYLFKEISVTESIPNLSMLGLIILLHFFSIFCIFYCIYFSAKTIKIAETQDGVTGDDFIGEFFLIWFFPVGIWLLQPRINKIISGEVVDDEDW